MKRREFMITLGASAMAMRASPKKSQPIMQTSESDEVQRHNASFDRRRKDYPQLDWEIKHMRIPELSHPMRLLHLAQALHRKGYKARTIEKIIGGNYVRIFKEVVG